MLSMTKPQNVKYELVENVWIMNEVSLIYLDEITKCRNLIQSMVKYCVNMYVVHLDRFLSTVLK